MEIFAMNLYSTFPKAPGLEPRHHIQLMPYPGSSLLGNGGILQLFRDAISVFLSTTTVVYWPPTRPNMPFQRRESAYSIGGGELGWRCGTGLKSHSTLTDWCTGRVWPVNCTTVISAWWRSNMPFQGRRKWHIPVASHGEILSGRLIYYITRWRQEVS